MRRVTTMCAVLIAMPLATRAQEASPPEKAAPNSAAAPASLAPTFQERLSTIDAAMRDIVDLTADFRQTKTSPLLRKPMVSSGSLVARGDQVLWQTIKPRPAMMWAGPGEVRLYYPEDRLVEIYTTGAIRGIATGPLPRMEALRDQFDLSEVAPDTVKADEDDAQVTSQGSAPASNTGANNSDDSSRHEAQDGEPRWLGVQLTPKDAAWQAQVKWVRVLIDLSVPCVTRFVMANADGEFTRVDFEAIKINQALAQDSVKLNLPEGVRESRPLGGATQPAPPAEKPASSAPKPAGR